MKTILSLTILTVLLVSSCGTSNEVTNGGLFQKRKYNKGFYWNRGSNLKNSEGIASAEMIKNVDENSEETFYASSSENEIIASRSVDEVLNSDAVQDAEQSEILKVQEEVSTQSDVNERNVTLRNIKSNGLKKEKRIKSKGKDFGPVPASNLPFIVMIILAILLPPLAVFLFEGASTRFWFDLVFFLIGAGVGFILFGALGAIFALLAIVYALLIICNVI